jgi:hypothetical protein
LSAPARELFREAFIDAVADLVPVASPSALTKGEGALDVILDVRRLEIRYDGGKRPEAVLEIDLSVSGLKDRSDLRTTRIARSELLSRNRVGHIVTAYSRLLSLALADMVVFSQSST